MTDKMMSEIRVTPLLGVQDLNRSSTLVKIGGKHVLLDCGLKLNSTEAFDDSNGHQSNGNGYDDDSLLPNLSILIGSEAVHTSIDCVIISHYHLDHSGALPYLTEMIGYKGPIYMTQPTKTIAPFVWRDCQKNLHERKFFPDFLTSSRINACLSKVTTIVYSQVISVDNNMTVTVYPSNQPLGPDTFCITVDGQSIYYIGGCNLKPSTTKPPSPSVLPSPSHLKAKETRPKTSDEITPSSSSNHGELTIKMNNCMLSVKVGHSVFHRQLNRQDMQLVAAVFNNLQFMEEANEDEFWQRIAYEMTEFLSPLNENSKYEWKSLFYDSLSSCGQVSDKDNFDSVSCQNLCDDDQHNGAVNNSTNSSGGGKKKRKAKKAQIQVKNEKYWQQSSGDLIKFDSPEKPVKMPSNKPTNDNLSPTIQYNPDPVIIDEQHLLISSFAERLKTSQITSEFWIGLSRDLKKKGKITKSTAFLEEYFKKLSIIQLEIMKSSSNALEAKEKWPHFDLLNDIDLSHFFEDKWSYRHLKKHFLIDSTTPNKPTKSKKQKQKQLKQQKSVNNYDHQDHLNQHQSTSPINHNKLAEKHRHKHQHRQLHYQNYQEEEDNEIEPQQQIIHYRTPPEDLADQLITITLFANRLKQTEISSEFWKLLQKDFENIGKPIKPGVNLQDHYKQLAEIQLDVMKNADNMITAVSRWPLFMLLHDLPLDIFLDDKWTYRKLKPRFCY